MSIRKLTAAVGALILAVATAIAGETYTVKFVHVTDAVYTITVSPDGTRAAFAAEGGLTRIVDTGTGQPVFTVEWPSVPIQTIRFNRDGTKLALVSQTHGISIRDVANGQEIVAIKAEPPIYAVDFSPDGTRLAAGTRTARVFDLATGKETLSFAVAEAFAVDVAFSADGARLAVASTGNAALVYDLASGSQALSLPHAAGVNAVAFSPDGKVLATGGQDGVLRIFDAVTGQMLRDFKGQEAPIIDIAYNADGTRIVSGSGDLVVRLWDVAAGAEIAALKGHQGDVHFVAFSADGQRLFTAGGATARIWTRHVPARLAKSLTGIWHLDLGGDPGQIPPEYILAMCREAPISVRESGTVILFQSSGPAVPEAQQHYLCRDDLSCLFIAGPPAQGADVIAEGTLSLEEDKGKICWPDGCREILRCPAMEWTETERASGLARAWEDAVLKSGE